MKIYRWAIWGVAICLAVTVAGITKSNLIDETKVVKKVPTTHKVVALTFDDGPHYKTTPQLLAILKEKQVKATLFILGENAAQHPEILAQAVADGHEIGTHAYSHRALNKLPRDQVAEELDKAEKVIAVVAPRPILFRPPGGAVNDNVLAVALNKGYTTVLWSVDPRDWSRPSVAQVVNTVMHDVKPGSIVLLHDGQYPLPTPEAIVSIIDQLRAEGYTIVTVGELLQYYEERK
ncbi:MAG: polysaccharide deacetylase family protein [Veillonellales bacterium]